MKGRLSRRKTNDRGFGLIDAMAMCVIVAIALLAVASIQTEYMKRQSLYLRRMVGQNVLAAFLSDVQTKGRSYPLLSDGTQPVTYVFCYGRDGMPVTNDQGDLGAQVSLGTLDTHMPSPICKTQGRAQQGYELHMVRDLANPDYADLYIIGLQNGTPGHPGEDVAYKMRILVPQSF